MLAAVIIPDGHVALGKLAQALIHGAKVVSIRGSFDDALRVVRELGERGGVTIVNSINPFRIEGQKTAAFEICDALGEAPDVHCIPVGNAGNITAYWRGYVEYSRDGVTTRQPRMLGWQAAGAAPLVIGEPVPYPETIATAIRIGNPASWDGAIAARDESGGAIESVTDAEILEAYRALASLEGVFVEPASAASVAGLWKAAKAGLIARGETVVCTVTGHGLKDPNRAIAEIEARPAVDAANRRRCWRNWGCDEPEAMDRALYCLCNLARGCADDRGRDPGRGEDRRSTEDSPLITTTTPSIKKTTPTTPRKKTPKKTGKYLPQPDPAPDDPYAPTPIVQVGVIEIPKIGLVHPVFEGITLTVIDHGPGHWPGKRHAVPDWERRVPRSPRDALAPVPQPRPPVTR